MSLVSMPLKSRYMDNQVATLERNEQLTKDQIKTNLPQYLPVKKASQLSVSSLHGIVGRLNLRRLDSLLRTVCCLQMA
jgi:hypothetical protein